MLRETIYDHRPFSEDERYLLLSPVGNLRKDRRLRGVPFEHIDDLMSEEEYHLYKSETEMLYDLFLLFRHRGDFDKAFKYENLSNYDAVKSIESLPRDVFIRNEYEYYKWRTSKL